MADLFWSNVGVKMQSSSGIGAAQTISAISKASPAVVSNSGVDPTDGDYILLLVNGMNNLNARVFRVGTVSAGTSFELEGEDSTNYDDFISGTWYAITFDTSFGTFTEVNSSGGEPNFEDTTTIHQKAQTQVPVSTTPFTVQFTSKFDLGSAALIEAKLASDMTERRAFMIEFSNGQRICFYGYISTGLIPGGTAQGLVTTPVSLTVDTTFTPYST